MSSKNKNKTYLEKALRLVTFVSEEVLEPYVSKYRADYSTSKLRTAIFLRLFLFSWSFDASSMSLRTIATQSKSRSFQQLADLDEEFSVSKSGLSERLEHIPWRLFRDLFEDIAEKSLQELPGSHSDASTVNELLEQTEFSDSTIVTLTAKLVTCGYTINEGQKSIKTSVAMHGRKIPTKALVLTELPDSSENVALKKLLDLGKNGTIHVFDRGMNKLETFQEIINSGNHFLTRMTAKNYSIEEERSLPEQVETETLTILKDEFISFPQLKEEVPTRFRLITCRSKEDKDTLVFLTSLLDVSASDVTELYRLRWGIEILFRFLKRELALEKVLSYSENGIKVHIYLTLIAFLLAWIYKEQNQMRSFKRAREELRWGLLDIMVKEEFERGVRLGSVNSIHTAFNDSS